MDAHSFHERFREAREKIPGMSKYELWRRSSVGESMLSKIESGKTIPGEETLAKLWPHLGVPLHQLLDWAQEERERRAFGDEEAQRLQAARRASLTTSEGPQAKETPMEQFARRKQETKAKQEAERLAKLPNSGKSGRSIAASWDTNPKIEPED